MTMTPVRERVTWIRSGPLGRSRISHPFMWRVTEPDGYVRWFETKREAQEWIAAYEGDARAA